LEIKKASEEVDEKGKQSITDVNNINNKLSLPEIKQKTLGQLETKSHLTFRFVIKKKKM